MATWLLLRQRTQPHGGRGVYISIVIHRQICFVLSELISVARQYLPAAGWLKRQTKASNHIYIFSIFIYIYICIFFIYTRHISIYIYMHSKTYIYNYTYLYSYVPKYIYHHCHVVPPARISLTLSRQFSLSFITSGRSSGLQGDNRLLLKT